MNIFANFIPHKPISLIWNGYIRTLVLMNKSIISSLKKRSTLAKVFYSNLSEYRKEGLINHAIKYIQLILEANEQNIAKMSVKADDPKTPPETYWFFLNRFSNNKKDSNNKTFNLVDSKLSDFKKKS